MQQDGRSSVRLALGAGVVVISLIAILVTVMFLRQSALVYHARNWVLHTHEVTENIEALSNKIKDAALYQRNYLVSGDPAFLEAYNSLIKNSSKSDDLDNLTYDRSIAESIRRLQMLTADNPVQQRNIISLQKATEDLLGYMDEMIELQQRSPKEAASAVNAIRGKHILDRIRTVTADMLAEETNLLTLRTQADEINAQRNTQLVLTAIGFFYVSMLLLIWVAARQWRQTKNMEQQHHMRALEVAAANEKLQQANKELEILNEQIKESGQTRLRAVVDNAMDGVMTINARGMIESFNPACERIFGYKIGEIVGRNIEILIPASKNGDTTLIGTAEREVLAKRKDGTIFPMDMAISSFWLEGEEHFSAILRDITRRKHAEAELMRYTRELEHSNQELDDFAYIASHDLKEPLRGLFNHASFLLEDYQGKLDEEGMRRLTRLSQLAQRMEQLVNDLLYFSRLGRSELAVQSIDPNQIIREIAQMSESFIKERNARITVPNPMPSIVCDRPRITEVFRNLITNAVKYNNSAERIVEIGFLDTANAPHGPEKNVFYVKDNGIGIEPEFHQEIFRIFRRLNSSEGEEQGTGVGLTFVKKIVERHKGHIWLESAPGQGTTFYFNLNQEE